MNFMAGINVGGWEVRRFPDEIVKVLKHTPINWIRVHHLPNRKLSEMDNASDKTYLDGINYLCRNGYNIIAPLEVGTKENTDTVPFDGLDKFIELSYDHAKSASHQIAKIAEEHHRQVIFGIENEIDPKSWILQSLPGIGWRGTFATWVELAVNVDRKYERLNNILKGIRDTNSGAKTMTNVNAEDPRIRPKYYARILDSIWDKLDKYSRELKEHSIVLDDIYGKLIDWHTELLRIKDKLDVDYVGLDNYSNYIKKYPVYGFETGEKITEAERLSGKQVLNAEFGYTTYRTPFRELLFFFLQRPSAPEMQRQFFENSLRSIEDSPSRSIGTFPWVLFSDPTDHRGNPEQENYFGLTEMKKGNMTKSPAFTYYLEWLTRRLGSQRS
jgi:hypothetical protein